MKKHVRLPPRQNRTAERRRARESVAAAAADSPRPTDQQIKDEFLLAMVEAGTPERFVRAFLKTGIMPMLEEGYRAASRADRAAWDQALHEYDAVAPDLKPEIAAARARQAANQYRAN